MKLVKQRHVVNLIEVLASRSKVFIVLELVTGGELFDKVVECGRFDEQTARCYFQQLVTGLEHCHRQGVCHRDLKPENLLLDEATGDLKISDFGLSALYGSASGIGVGNGPHGTQLLHTSCGTPNYVAPEVLSESGYDGFKADVWSCGVILFVLLAGFLPFEEPSMSMLFDKICRAEFTCPDWFSPGARSLLAHVLVPEPSARYTLAQIKSHPWFAPPSSMLPGSPQAQSYLAATDKSDGEEGLSGERSASGEGLWERRESERHSGERSMMAAEGARVRGASSSDDQDEDEPQRINAFELITLCGGLNLMPMFAGDVASMHQSTRFHSQRPPSEIIDRLRHVLTTELGAECTLQRKQFKIVGTLRTTTGQTLSCSVQVFTIALRLYLVDWRRGQGDLPSHHKLYHEVRTRCADLITPRN